MGGNLKLPTIIRNIRGIIESDDSQEKNIKSINRLAASLTEDDKNFLVALKSYYKGDKLLLEEYLDRQLD